MWNGASCEYGSDTSGCWTLFRCSKCGVIKKMFAPYNEVDTTPTL